MGTHYFSSQNRCVVAAARRPFRSPSLESDITAMLAVPVFHTDMVCADAWFGKGGYPDFAEAEAGAWSSRARLAAEPCWTQRPRPGR